MAKISSTCKQHTITIPMPDIGYAKNQIKSIFLKVGWSEQDIKKYISETIRIRKLRKK